MKISARSFALVTGASSGIDYHLARECADAGFDLLLAADESAIERAADDFRALGVEADFVEADLATTEGVDRLLGACRHLIDITITGTIYLIQKVGREMRERGEGRILVTGSIAGFLPGACHAVYNGTKAFIDSFCFAVRHELKESGVGVTCLVPGATETDFFERADMLDTKVGTREKEDPADVAKTGFKAMMRGDGDVVRSWQNKLQTAIANITPAGALAALHAKDAEPGTAEK